MSKGKAGDQSGIVLEMLQNAGSLLMERIAQLFSELLQPHPQIPEHWTQTLITVLLKKGDA
eukprot:7157795-Karenia_brevis.AAC.1